MSELGAIKDLVRGYHRELDAATGDGIRRVLERNAGPGYRWRGMHPFYDQHGADAVAEVFWQPLRHAMTALQRREDIFIAGANHIDGGRSRWVCGMGHFMGLFDRDWLGIPATGRMTFLRYAEFDRVEDGRIGETALFLDIPGVMQQAGVNPFAPQTGASFLIPGPRSHDGLLLDDQPPDATRRTLELIGRMCDDLVSSDLESPQDELRRTWHDDMIWFGPAGIGATYTLPRYQKQHQGPFGEGLDDIRFHGHVCRVAEGRYGGWFGWPNLTMRPSGGFLGLPASGKTVEMRVVDIYRREGDKLAENWVFIDIPYFLAQQGVDLLERMRRAACG